jgi:hypothetical protein
MYAIDLFVFETLVPADKGTRLHTPKGHNFPIHCLIYYKFYNSYFNSPRSSVGTAVTGYSEEATTYTTQCCIRYQILSHGALLHSIQNGSVSHKTSSSVLIGMFLPRHSGCGIGLNNLLDLVPA